MFTSFFKTPWFSKHCMLDSAIHGIRFSKQRVGFFAVAPSLSWLSLRSTIAFSSLLHSPHVNVKAPVSRYASTPVFCNARTEASLFAHEEVEPLAHRLRQKATVRNETKVEKRSTATKQASQSLHTFSHHEPLPEYFQSHGSTWHFSAPQTPLAVPEQTGPALHIHIAETHNDSTNHRCTVAKAEATNCFV